MIIHAFRQVEDGPMLGYGTCLPEGGPPEAVNGDSSMTAEEQAEKLKQGQDDFKVSMPCAAAFVQNQF